MIFVVASLPPIFYHIFRAPLPYVQTLALQEAIYKFQLARKPENTHKDIFLLLQHRPVYTSGRRQTEDIVKDERTRLTNIGADFFMSSRGGELTYHGPGQIVGYPLLDLSRPTPPMGVRDFICRMQTALKSYLKYAHNIECSPSEHTGLFLDPYTKIGSIGVQMRHRLTTHGFSLNVSTEPRAWFDQIVACGLADVKAGSIQGVTGEVYDIEKEMRSLIQSFGETYERDMAPLELELAGEVGEAIAALEEEADRAGGWPKLPTT